MKHILHYLTDIFFVIRGLWILVLLNLIALFAFLVAPQGPDVLLCIVEDFEKQSLRPAMTFVFLIFGTFFWSIASEFSTRMVIYMSDSSGFALSSDRVGRRKMIQKKLVKWLLFYPWVLLILGFIRAIIINWEGINALTVFAMIAIVIFFILLAWLVGNLYYGSLNKKVTERFGFLKLDKTVKDWAEKLFGMFSDLHLMVAFPEGSPVSTDRKLLLKLTGQNIPDAFELVSISPPEEGTAVHKLHFHAPLRFYKGLLKQFFLLCGIAFAFILIFAFLPAAAYENIGATALLSFAFACWPLVFVLFLFLDKAQPFRIKIPYRLFALIWVIFCSVINNDHPVRTISGSKPATDITLNEHFENWYRNLEKNWDDSIRKTQIPNADTIYSLQNGNDSSYIKTVRQDSVLTDSIPVVFVCAEGGALRTGAYAAMMLSELQDSFPQLKNHIYAYSSVSGGTVGVNIFQSFGRLPAFKSKYVPATNEFFSQDYLSPVTGKFVFGEILNYFLPFHVAAFDREIVLEESWENGWKKATGDADPANYLAASFEQNSTPNGPAIFINTEEVESGYQCVWSNVRVPDFPYADKRDLAKRTGTGIPYSSAIGLSSRFPMISPSGAFWIDDTLKRHYVDGGYYENMGEETMLQVLKCLDLKRRYPRVKMYVIQFNISEDKGPPEGISAANEIADILSGIYNTRGSRGDLAQHNLKEFIYDHNGYFVDLKLHLGDEHFPMDWILSDRAMRRLQHDCDSSVRLKIREDSLQLSQLFLYRK